MEHARPDPRRAVPSRAAAEKDSETRAGAVPRTGGSLWADHSPRLAAQRRTLASVLPAPGVVQRNGFKPFIKEINWAHIRNLHFAGGNKPNKSIFSISEQEVDVLIRDLFAFEVERGVIKAHQVGWQMPLYETDGADVFGWDQDGNFTTSITIIIKVKNASGECDVINAFPGLP